MEAVKKVNHLSRFKEIYHCDPHDVGFCPYRVCPLGAHSDHQAGKVMGFALDHGIHIAYKPKLNGIIEAASLDFEKRAQFHVHEPPEEKVGDWADYLRGVTLELGMRYRLRYGLGCVLAGSLPIGGLSSSAAVTIVFLRALCKVNDITLSNKEIITLAKNCENKYVGVACGKLDQSCEVLCRAGHLLYLDTNDDSFELLPPPDAMPPYRIAIFFSGMERSLVGSKFNMRVDECRAAAYALRAYAGLEYGKFSDCNLRSVPRDVYLAYRDRLPENWRRRAEHWYSEFERVEKGREAWLRGDLEEFGRLVFASGESSIKNYETGSPELKKMVEIMQETEGIYGGRFSGAGFKGCCMALIRPEAEASIRERMEREYLKAFPAMAGRYRMAVCGTTDGVGWQ